MSVGDRLRVVTPYPYPDNDLIEVYIEESDDSRRVRVTDMGETLRHLFDLGMDTTVSRARLSMVETIAEGRAVNVHRGQLLKDGPIEALGEMMFDVIVTARGVSDMVLAQRTYQHATFQEEVAALLEDASLEFERGVPLTGETGQRYRVDFLIPKTGRYVEALSPASAGGIKNSVNRAFRMWSDVNGNLKQDAKVTLLNDLDFRWKDPDLALLQRVSDVRYWTRREELPDVLIHG